MKEKLLKIFDIYSKRKAGYIPLHEREELADEIVGLTIGCADDTRKEANPEKFPSHRVISDSNVDWAGLDPVKWGDVKNIPDIESDKICNCKKVYLSGELDAVGTKECKATTKKYIIFGDTEDIDITP